MKLVAVTTSADRAAAASIPFTLAGLRTISLPCIEIEPVVEHLLEAVRASIGQADLVVVSSGRTIEILWPTGSLPPCDFAAVGPVTARTIEQRGGTVTHVGTGGANELADQLADHVAGSTVVWPHAQGADPIPLKQTAELAAVFAAPMIYGAVSLAPALDEVDVVSFASPSAVAGWLLSRPLGSETVGVIGDTTRRAAEEAGVQPAVVAPKPTFQSLAGSVAEYLGVSA